ncbi:heavy metal translocating P-type ATPase [Patescibacteria group bacterium]|nr:heavy metal translocating P-type ATPase [Patescibacteria group bacterium]
MHNGNSHTTLKIEGMDCASCVRHIENDLSKQKGVTKANVNYANETAEVHFNPAEISQEQIIQTVKKSGYKATSKDHNMAEMHHGSHQSHEDHSAHAKAETNQAVKKRLSKLIFSAIASIVILILTFFWDPPQGPVIMLILSLLVIVISGREFFEKGIPNLLRARPGMDTLIALGVGAAFIYSSYIVLFTTQTEEYFMDVAIITTFILTGRYLEALAKGKASEAIKKLLELSARVAHKLQNGKTIDVPIEDLQKGDLILVKPGEKIPVDGQITEGNAVINESMVTGESIPSSKKEGDKVIGATINGNTAFTMRVEKVGSETMLARIIKLVEEAQMSKAPVQKLVDKISAYFVWGVILVALTTLFVWHSQTGDFSRAMIYTVSVLIIACPCALGLATPVSIIVGSGRAASLGILIKNAESLERIHKVTAVCFDKTGTITTGHPEVKEFFSLKGVEKENLALALALEEKSEHPLAKSIIDFISTKKSIPTQKIQDVKAVVGKGITGKTDKTEYHFGSLKYIKELKIDLSDSLKKIENLQEKGQTVLILSDKKEIKAVFAIQDTLKESSKEAIEALKKRNIKPVLLTGDNEKVAHAIANEVGIDEIHAEISPEQKVQIIKDLQKENHVVAMIGDGINDSPALAQANIGIAMGTGTDIAMESGDVVIVKGDLKKAVEAMQLSEATLRNIKQNLFWAFFYNTISIPVAAIGLLNPMISSFAMAFSSVSVVLNALRLRRFKVK